MNATNQQIDTLYAKTAFAYGVDARDEAGDLWIKVLAGRFTIDELDAALAHHAGDTSLDDQGRRRGSRMPAPADLKEWVENKRVRRLGELKKFCGGPDCTEGWKAVVDPKTKDRRVTKCPDCAALLEQAKELTRQMA
jgi:hypothetical protein